jgi:hypothetical protein
VPTQTPREAFAERIRHALPDTVGECDADLTVNTILAACDLYYTAATHPRQTGPSLTYTHRDGETFTAIDLGPVRPDRHGSRIERGICRALLVEALRLLDESEPAITAHRLTDVEIAERYAR